MSPRPQLAIGDYGNISYSRAGALVTARCRFRGLDGVTRQISAAGVGSGRTEKLVASSGERAAKANLLAKMGELKQGTKGSPDALAVCCPKCLGPAGNPCINTARKDITPIKTAHAERSAAAAELPPVYRVAMNDTSQALTMTLVAERITGYTEPAYESADMLRGTFDEPFARELYDQHHAKVTETGFMICDDFGFKLGYSPDGLVGDHGLIEIKSRLQKKQLATILADEVPAENMAQIQCGLLVSGRDWLDYVSYCGGMPLYVKRVYPDQKWADAIVEACAAFEARAAAMLDVYTATTAGLPVAERHEPYEEMRF